MTILSHTPGSGRWTDYGKRQIALAMVHRGEQFLGAAMLLKKEGGNGYVWRHLVCQSAELIMKGSLLLVDYDRYQPELKKFGHQLLVLGDVCVEAFNLSPMTGALRTQIANISDLYEHHELRYASGMDILINPDTIGIEILLGRIFAALVVIRRAVERSKTTT